MKKFKIMLLGIVFILLGIYGSIFFGTSNGGFLIDILVCFGFFSPYIGLIIFFCGFFMKEKSNNSDDKEN